MRLQSADAGFIRREKEGIDAISKRVSSFCFACKSTEFRFLAFLGNEIPDIISVCQYPTSRLPQNDPYEKFLLMNLNHYIYKGMEPPLSTTGQNRRMLKK